MSYLVWMFLLVLLGCAPSTLEQQNIVITQDQPRKDLPHTDTNPVTPSTNNQQAEPSLFEDAKRWKPRFIQAGLSSGIMIEFTGMKKGKKLSAKYASIELLRYLPDTTTDASRQKPPHLAKPVQLQSAINDLQQAFFKVSPGTYLARLTNEWCDRSSVRDVVVKEGEYSVLTNDVYTAWLRMKQLSDSTKGR